MQNSFFSDFFAENSQETCVRFLGREKSSCGNSACVPRVKECDFSAVDAFPLAMAYVPMQKYENVCSPEDGFAVGTMFGDLNLPFTGRKDGIR